MGIVDNTYRTLTCSKCDKTLTFNIQEFQTPEGQKKTLEEAPWLRTYRILNVVLDGRVFGYCSDECTLRGIESGEVNPVEKKVIEMPAGGNLEAIKRAAAEAAAKAEGTRRLKEGQPVNIVPGS
jgi:hypothetical protein